MRRFHQILSLLLCAALLLPCCGLSAAAEGALPESAHDYADNLEQRWDYTYPGEARGLFVTFSEDTWVEAVSGWIRIDDLVDIGIDCLNPLEVKAGMQPVLLKEKYGHRLVLHGGVNAVLWDQREAIVSEIERVVPLLKQDGGYIFSSDHSIPNSVSLENMKAIMEAVKRAGKY